MSNLLHRLRARVRNRRFDGDLLEELRLHEEMKRLELERAGRSPDEARAGARRALGNVTLMREQSRAVWVAPWLESVVQDVRYAARSLVRQPLHSLTAGIVLVLAIGLNASLFTVFKAIALEPWPATDPDRIVRVWARTEGRPVGPSVDEYRFMRQHVKSFSGLVAHTVPGYGSRLQAPGQPDAYLQTVWVSANFFNVLGARMQLGSGFIDDDDLDGNRRSPLVISHNVWKNYFAGDTAVVGRPVSVAGIPFTVVGVLEPKFDGIGRPVELWMPLSAVSAVRPSMSLTWEPSAKSANCCVNMAGRIADGVSQRQAREELQLLHERFSTAAARTTGRVEIFGTAEISGPGAQRYGILAIFGAAVVLVLILACANVGNLQLARGLARRREIATRMSIGAGRWRIVRQLLTEALVLAAAAGAVAIALSAVLPGLVFRFIGEDIPTYMQSRFEPDARLVFFTLAICVAACLAFALAPALHATRVTIPLGMIDRASTRPARFHLRSLLLGTQIAICTALLVGAGLVTRAIVHAMAFDPGFDVQGVQLVSAGLPAERYTVKQRQEFTGRLLRSLDDIREDPVALAQIGPIDGSRLTMFMALPHQRSDEYRPVFLRPISRRYFEVLGVPLASGRMFSEGATGEAVINEALARVYWPGEDAVGRMVHDVRDRGTVRRPYTIVGVVRDTYLTGLEEIEPVIFTPTTLGTFVARGGPASTERIRAAALALSSDATITARPLKDNVRKYLEDSRTGATLGWAIGLLALALAMVGVCGVFAYAVEERRREIGIRLALGAARAHIVRMLMATSGRAMVFGLGAGLLLSLACGPALRSYLYGLSGLDPGAYAFVAAILAGAAGIATFIPARRACRVDPAVTLRAE